MGGYLRWPQLICLYNHTVVSSQKGYFSSKIESIQKDVDCVFRILKKMWKILNYGTSFQDINVVEKVFVFCCMLHNNVLSEMESRESDICVWHGGALKGDGTLVER